MQQRWKKCKYNCVTFWGCNRKSVRIPIPHKFTLGWRKLWVCVEYLYHLHIKICKVISSLCQNEFFFTKKPKSPEITNIQTIWLASNLVCIVLIIGSELDIMKNPLLHKEVYTLNNFTLVKNQCPRLTACAKTNSSKNPQIVKKHPKLGIWASFSG